MNTEIPPKSAWARTVAQIKLDRGCEDPRCAGYPRGISRALTFDHRPGVVKLFEISQGVQGKLRTGSHVAVGGTGGIREVLRRLTWQDILDEIDKCDVVCKNCHEVRNTERAAVPDAQV
jgi:hypothetical protein